MNLRELHNASHNIKETLGADFWLRTLLWYDMNDMKSWYVFKNGEKKK